jgi:Tfp pilus assembly protein PilF
MKTLNSILLLVFFLLSACSSNPTTPLTAEDKAKIYLESAMTSLNEGDPTGALQFLKNASDLQPNKPETHYLLTLAYFQKHESGLAIRSAKKTLELSPDFTPAKNALGKLLMDQGKLDEAEKYLLQAANDLTYREAYLSKTNLGLLYSKKQNIAEAERWYSRAIFDAGESSCIALYERGKIYFGRSEFQKAKNDFFKASKNFCANYTNAHLAYGKTLISLKKYNLARSKMIEIQQLFPHTEIADQAGELLKELP